MFTLPRSLMKCNCVSESGVITLALCMCKFLSIRYQCRIDTLKVSSVAVADNRASVLYIVEFRLVFDKFTIFLNIPVPFLHFSSAFEMSIPLRTENFQACSNSFICGCTKQLFNNY